MSVLSGREDTAMFNMNSKKTRQRVSIVIIVILVIAMIIPTVAYFF